MQRVYDYNAKGEKSNVTKLTTTHRNITAVGVNPFIVHSPNKLRRFGRKESLDGRSRTRDLNNRFPYR